MRTRSPPLSFLSPVPFDAPSLSAAATICPLGMFDDRVCPPSLPPKPSPNPSSPPPPNPLLERRFFKYQQKPTGTLDRLQKNKTLIVCVSAAISVLRDTITHTARTILFASCSLARHINRAPHCRRAKAHASPSFLSDPPTKQTAAETARRTPNLYTTNPCAPQQQNVFRPLVRCAVPRAFDSVCRRPTETAHTLSIAAILPSPISCNTAPLRNGFVGGSNKVYLPCCCARVCVGGGFCRRLRHQQQSPQTKMNQPAPQHYCLMPASLLCLFIKHSHTYTNSNRARL
jgi:hypothetical protein